MRYDDILHRTFIASIGGMLANPVNAGVKQEKIVDLAWGVAVTAATWAKANSTLICQNITPLTGISIPADPTVTGVSSGVELNSQRSTEVKTSRPTTVQNSSGEFISDQK